ncbi:MAG: DNA polymerase III subunit alpha [Chloroflexota bacterium]|nr:DNA polymerase III subunit alpha [Chloroflexota bacterium]
MASQSANDFAHLHVHSEYSLLDGYSRTKELAKYAAKLGMSSIALTDHGNLYGAIEFYEAAKATGVKPIIGVETYVAPGKMTAKSGQDRDYKHLILLAQDEIGYRNLLELVTASWLEGYYYKPRVDRDYLAAHNQGLIALSACLGGEVAGPIVKGDYATAKANAAWYKEVFGDRYYIELQEHGLKEDKIVTPELIRLARELDLPVVATNDNHYTTREQAKAQDLLLCVQTSSTLEDPKRMRFETDEFYLKSPDEMAQLFGELPEAISNSLAIAERCNLELKFGRLNFPDLDHVIPKGETPDSFLARVCRERLPVRYPDVTQAIRDRLEYELDVIRTTGFSAYMLLVWDFVRWARERKIPAGPRGSAAGSIVLYLLGIADVDPIEYGLTFERFLNPERVQMPDVDMDFADDRREEVINYCIERYGRDHVAQMVTFGRLLARAALRDVGRALSYPLNEVDRVAKLIPALPAGMTIDRAMEQVKELKSLYEGDPSVRRLIDAAKSIEGTARHASTHAAGVVISGDPLTHHVPLQRIAKNDAMVMTQYPQKALEHIGLLKMDFLGLANLTMLAKCVEYVKETRGIELDLGALPLDDPFAFEKLSQGETHSIFQLEGSGMTRYVKELKPQTVRHLAAMVALYRPGPMAHIPSYIARKEGREPVTYPDPTLEDLLAETYGIIVYQDQVLQIVQRVAGYSLGRADILRRAMGKKDPEAMRQEKSSFIQGALERGYGKDTAEKLWEYIEPFAGYAFNKAHAFCYSFVAYQTAYLKAHYPVEWMAAVLTTDVTKPEKVVSALGECRRIGIPILVPNINYSQVRFTVEHVEPDGSGFDRGIRFGLAAVKNVGEGAVETIVAEREERGPFKSLDDLCSRVDLRLVNKRVLEALVKCGAMDDFGPRERVLAGLDACMAAGQARQRAASAGQMDLFGGFGGDEGAAPSLIETPLPMVPEIGRRERLAWEKEAVGVFLSDHPFMDAARFFTGPRFTPTSAISADLADVVVTIAGNVAAVRRITTRKGDTMVVATLEDLHGSIEVVGFPRTFQQYADLWVEDKILVVQGKVDARDDRLQIIAEGLEAWSPSEGTESLPDEAVVPFTPTVVVAPSTHRAWRPTQAESNGNGSRNGNGHGSNGHTNGNGARNGTKAAAPEVVLKHLRVVVRRTDRLAADVACLERLQFLFDNAGAGQSPYEVIVALPGGQFRVSAPDCRTRFSADLERQLVELIGANGLLVERG